MPPYRELPKRRKEKRHPSDFDAEELRDWVRVPEDDPAPAT